MIYYEVGSCWTWRLHTSPFYFSLFERKDIALLLLKSLHFQVEGKESLQRQLTVFRKLFKSYFILWRNKRATRLIFYINWRGVCVCGSFSELLNVELWTGFTIKRSKITTYKTPVPKFKQEWDSLTQALLLAQKHLQQITRIELSYMNIWEVSRRKSPN